MSVSKEVDEVTYDCTRVDQYQHNTTQYNTENTRKET